MLLVTTEPAPDRREPTDRAAGEDDGARADRAAVREHDGLDDAIGILGDLALGGDGPRIALVGQDGAGTEQDAVLDDAATLDDRAVLDLDAIPDPARRHR